MTAIYLSVQVCLVSLFARFCHITSQQSVVPRGDESLIREPVPVTGELVGEEPGQVGPLQQLLPFAVSLWHKASIIDSFFAGSPLCHKDTDTKALIDKRL